MRVYTVKLRSSSTPNIVNGSLSFQKELLGLGSGMVRSGKAHNEKMFSGWPEKRISNLRVRVKECAP